MVEQFAVFLVFRQFMTSALNLQKCGRLDIGHFKQSDVTQTKQTIRDDNLQINRK